jgi:hypothetical protein
MVKTIFWLQTCFFLNHHITDMAWNVATNVQLSAPELTMSSSSFPFIDDQTIPSIKDLQNLLTIDGLQNSPVDEPRISFIDDPRISSIDDVQNLFSIDNPQNTLWKPTKWFLSFQ